MLTNNYKNFNAVRQLCVGSLLATDIAVTAYGGSTRYLSTMSNVDMTSSVSLRTSGGTYSYPTIGIGSGGTQPSASDYCMESLITTISGTITASGVLSVNNGTLTKELIVSIVNTASSDITVREVGITMPIGRVSSSSTDTGSLTADCLMDRTLLDEPITIPPGESASISYTLEVEV